MHQDRGAEHVQILVWIDGTRYVDLECVQTERAGNHEQVPDIPSYANERSLVCSFSKPARGHNSRVNKRTEHNKQFRRRTRRIASSPTTRAAREYIVHVKSLFVVNYHSLHYERAVVTQAATENNPRVCSTTAC